MERPYFPMFVDLSGKHIFVAGGGKIACRRIKSLLKFGARIHVAAPRICEEIAVLARQRPDDIEISLRKYRPLDLDGMDLAIAATDDREVNRDIHMQCRERKIPVNVADDKTLCDFYFPSVVLTDDVVIGIGSGGENPGRVKEVRKKIEKLTEI